MADPDGDGADRTRDRAPVAHESSSDADERRRVGDVMGAKYVWDGDPDDRADVSGVVLRSAGSRDRALTVPLTIARASATGTTISFR